MQNITIAQVLAEVRELEHHDFPDGQLVKWLSRLDGMVYDRVIKGREGGPEEFGGYTADTDHQTVLLIPEPYGEIYTAYLLAQIAQHRQENDRYNDHMAVHQDRWDAWAAEYARSHRQRLGGQIRF